MNVNKPTTRLGLVAGSVKGRESAASVVLKREDGRVKRHIENALQKRGAGPAEAARTALQWSVAITDRRKISKELLSLKEAEAALVKTERNVLAQMVALQSGAGAEGADPEDARENLDMQLQEIVEDKEAMTDLIRESEESLGRATESVRSVERLLDNKRT